jgi:hypothetical protein
VQLYFRRDGKGNSVRPIAAIHISRGLTIYGTIQTSSSKMSVPLCSEEEEKLLALFNR